MKKKILFAILYFGLIPIFACVYCFLLPGDFYHATVQYETPTMNKTAEGILDSLQQNMLQRIKAAKEGDNCDSWRLSLDSLRVHSLKPEGEKVSFAVSGLLETNVQRHSEYYFTNRYSFLLNQRMITIPLGGSASVGFFLTSDEPMQIKVPTGDVNLQACLFRRLNYYDATLEIPENLYAQISGFASAIRGFPAHVPGQFARMLYISATTITTLGFGDIVPLTSRARMAVSFESILGIILMGLFVNAVSAERKGQIPRLQGRQMEQHEQ